MHFTIVIDARMYKNDTEKHGSTKFEAGTGILLHEMVHIFLMHFGCQGKQYAKEQEHFHGRSCEIDVGYTGHGRAWHLLCNVVEGASVKLWVRS